MPSLKLHGPRRPSDQGTSQRSTPASTANASRPSSKASNGRERLSGAPAAPTLRHADSSSSAEDTIHVSHKPSTTPSSTSEKGTRAESGRMRTDRSSASVQPFAAHGGRPSAFPSAPTTNRPWGRKGKAPVRDGTEAQPVDEEMIDPEDQVEEYNFSDEDEEADDDDTDLSSIDSRDSEPSVISISDDELGGSNRRGPYNDDVEIFDEDAKPWRHFTRDQRAQWETSYCSILDYPMGGIWDSTETYQRIKDEEMARYIMDFPLKDWVISRKLATDAFAGLVQRQKWRRLNIRIYSHGGPTEVLAGPHPAQMPYQRTGSLNALRGPPPPSAPQVMHHQERNQGQNPSMPHVPAGKMLASQPNAQPVARLPNGQPISTPGIVPATREHEHTFISNRASLGAHLEMPKTTGAPHMSETKLAMDFPDH